MAYVAKKGDKLVVVGDGVEGPAYERILWPGVAFSLDGRRVAYAARGEQQCRVVGDGVEGPVYDGIIKHGPSFHADGALEYLADKDGARYRMRHIPTEQ